MNRMKYTKSIEYISVDDYFSQEEKQLFLKIPHQVESQWKVNLISFDVPENEQYSFISRVSLVDILEPLTEEEKNSPVYRKILHNTSFFNSLTEDIGLYIKSHHGRDIFRIMQELYQYDKDNATILLNEYYTVALQSDEVKSFSERFVRQVLIMKDYLLKNQTVVDDYHIDYTHYQLLSEVEKKLFVEALYRQFGQHKKFEAFNDLDYTPAIVLGEYHIYDSASSSLYVIRDVGNIQQIYVVKVDRTHTICDAFEDGMSEFAFIHHQNNILLSQTITDKDLIGEIENGKLTKATVELVNMDLTQSYIVSDLIEQGKIKNIVPQLTFSELLKNYTLQHQYYKLEERSIILLLKTLKLCDNFITYDDFSQMDSSLSIEHEIINDNYIENIQKIERDDFSNLEQLPFIYQQQISDYFSQLLERNNYSVQSKSFYAIIHEKLSYSYGEQIQDNKLKNNKINL